MISIRLMICLLAVNFLLGCASRPINQPIAQVDPESGYRPNLLIPKRKNNDLSTLFILSFSGGGTRAAALSYGVLEELQQTTIQVDGEQRRLIDEVDLMTGVSGGSFTALSYALYGDQLFDEYEERFLKRNVQSALVWRAVNPLNWGKLLSGNYGRSELAAEYYDEILFEGATYADLLEREGPVAIATGTEVSSGARLSFYQQDFDLLCSDLGSVRLSRAAATSSAVPVVLTPVTLSNYGGSCGYEYPPWVGDILAIDEHERPAGRALARYHDMSMFQDSEHWPYVHLVDGGVSDNIGMRGVMEFLEGSWVSSQFAQETGLNQIRRLVVIIVNARSDVSDDWGQRESPPGLTSQLLQSSGVPIERYSQETIELLKDRAAVMSLRRELRLANARLAGLTEEEAEASVPKIEIHLVEVSFDRVSDPQKRSDLQNLPTSFVLPAEDVDQLREVAGELLRQSPDYQTLLQELQGDSGD
ncbi:MAG: patatin-like phospholipase family protein [Halioglobus sp.]